MQWWHWVLVILGVIVIGAVKLMFFNKMRQSKAVKRRFTDE